MWFTACFSRKNNDVVEYESPPVANKYQAQDELRMRTSAAVKQSIAASSTPPEKRGDALKAYDPELITHKRRGAIICIEAVFETNLPGTVPNLKRDVIVLPLKITEINHSSSTSLENRIGESSKTSKVDPIAHTRTPSESIQIIP